MGSLRVLKAPAKVNLHLEILGRRSDGFHEILSLFQAVSLFDRIRLRSLKDTGQVRVRCSLPIPAEENIVTAAVRLFRERSGLRGGVSVSIEKGIPVGAGLGGGSSDAATTLRGLNELFNCPLSEQQLAELALALGSDVPFFLGSPTALVRGRGERIRRVPGRSDYRMVLVWPGFAVATREAYGWYDRSGGRSSRTGHLSGTEVRRRFARLPPPRWGFFNSFQNLVEAHHPVVADIAAGLHRAGAATAGITGCGSAVFGVFDSAAAARRAALLARPLYPLVEVVSPLQSAGAGD
jgi:4-diphosphocytidyl-2-C-methyl-D-erythritol kinase